MEVEILKGFDEETNLIKLRASSSSEADILEKLWREGIRIISGGRWTIVISSPKLVNLTALYLTDEELKVIHNALTEYVKDVTLSSLLQRFYPEA